MRLHVIACFALATGMCAAEELKCTVSDAVLIEEAKGGTTTVKGRVSPGKKGRLELYQSKDEKSTEPALIVPLANTLIDSRWGDVEIRTQEKIKGPKLKLRWMPNDQACTESAAFSVAAPPPPELWLDWDKEIPVREGTPKISGRAGADVKRIRTVVLAPATAPDGGIEAEDDLQNSGRHTAEDPNGKKPKRRGAAGVAMLRRHAAQRLVDSMEDIRDPKKDPPLHVQTNARRVECLSGEIEQTMEVTPKDGVFEVVFSTAGGGWTMRVPISSERKRKRSDHGRSGVHGDPAGLRRLGESAGYVFHGIRGGAGYQLFVERGTLPRILGGWKHSDEYAGPPAHKGKVRLPLLD